MASLDLVCVTDENYAPHFTSLLRSIAANKGAESVRVHAVLDGVSERTIEKIADTVPELEVISYQVKDHKVLSLPPLLQISRATYLRLIIDELIDPKYDRLLYLDIDMTVTASLLPLWNSDLQGRPCGAVFDPGMDPDAFAARFELPTGGSYFNAGMLLLDMTAIRRGGHLSAALNQLLDGDDRIEFADQDALNVALWQAWTALDPAWNFQRKFLYDAFALPKADRPKILHFTEEEKPWRASEWHPYAWLYWKYLLQSPFAHDIRRQQGIGALRLVKFWLKYKLKAR